MMNTTTLQKLSVSQVKKLHNTVKTNKSFLTQKLLNKEIDEEEFRSLMALQESMMAGLTATRNEWLAELGISDSQEPL